MSIKAAVIVPHPPLIVPEVGCGQEERISKTVASYHRAARFIAEQKPETLIVISPHAPAYADYIHMASGHMIRGSLKAFGGETEIKVSLDEELIEAVEKRCGQSDFPAGTVGEKFESMDHATYVPLYFVNQYYTEYQLVICSLSGLSREETYQFGSYVQEAVETMGRRVVVIASGDLSHKLKESGPYSFAPEGPKLDEVLTGIMKTGEVDAFLEVDEKLCKLGAECGLGSFITMAGMLHKSTVLPEFLSYEGPFGVGYAVCLFRLQEKAEDNYVKLARETLEYYVRHDRLMPMPTDLPEEMLKTAAGAFVSLKKNGNLRGCIGTIEATQENVAWEIMYNAISAGAHDPRFMQVTAEELPELVYSVDILTPSNPVKDRTLLNCKKYGVIVSKGNRRGLLLPNLEGVDTVEQQIEIACQKAGISPEEDFRLECFEVIRHK